MHRRLAQNLLSTPAKLRSAGSRNLVRFNSSQAGGARGFNSALLFAGCAISGGLGYYVANSRSKAIPGANLVEAEPSYGSPDDFKQAIAELRTTLGVDAVSTDSETVKPYGYSENDYHPGARSPFSSSTYLLPALATFHSVVVYPQSTEDVSKIVKIACKYRVPITPYSGGTSLEGNFRAVRVYVSCFYHLIWS